MPSRQCCGIEREFNETVARRELEGYRRRGPAGTTRILIDALRRQGVGGRSLLDVGGGVGVIQHELVAAGVSRVTSVDASPAYLEAQRVEAQQRGYADRAVYLAGDFVAVAPDVPDSDIVTLDRVICCYDDMPALVGASAARANRLYGIVVPRATWWNAAGIRLANVVVRLRRSAFRAFLHPPAAIEALLAARGLRRQYLRDTFIWRIAIYARVVPENSSSIVREKVGATHGL
jgi:magnesium-protoporphyrin O-methyltransferase